MSQEFRWRRITPDQAKAIRTAMRAGVTASTLAAEYGVSTRTIFRAVRRADELAVRVRIGPWHATFVVTPDGPTQVESWRAA